jgi:F-type H+-transporting ATPase subunit b
MLGRNRTRLGAILALLAAWPAAAGAAGGTLEIFPDHRVLILVVLFALLIVPTQRVLFAPVMRALEERRSRIEGGRERAGALSAKAEDMLRRYEEAVRDARNGAEQERRGSVDEARREQGRTVAEARQAAEKKGTSARGEIASALAGARAQLRREAELLAREAASRVLGRNLS